MEIPILYEDTHILAIDKPAGLVVHDDGRTEEPVLTDWILEKYPKTKGVGESIEVKVGENITKTIERPGIVHRLDRGTSGVLLIAKTKKGHAHLKEQFQNHTLEKKYLAFIYGELKDDYGIINRPIGKSPRDFRRWSASRGARGEMRPAETWWTRIAARGGFTLVEVEPKTGRTHQIRVHFKYLNHPIVGDELYAPEKPKALGFTNRTALHASSITFRNCLDKVITVKSQLPDDFKEAIEELGIGEFAKKKGVC